MEQITFVFPGQGSQYVGMGKELADNFASARNVLVAAGEILGFDLAELCFQGPEEKLLQTEITQPAILAVSLAIFEVLREKGIQPSWVAGHSLGEYSALVAAGTLSFPTGLQVVAQRGRWMAEAVPDRQGTMAAVLGLSPEAVEQICLEASEQGDVVPANFNSPGQIVISGTRSAVEKAGSLAKAKGAKRVLPLAVSGPFHSRLMAGVSDKLSVLLADVKLQVPQYSFVANTTGSRLDEVEEIKKSLVEQVKSPVLWQQSVEYLVRQGVSVFIEVGPGRVLSGLVKKIDKTVEVLNVEDCKTLNGAVKVLEGMKSDA